MYPNLKAEMARRGVTLTDLATATGRTVSTISQKALGKKEWLFWETIKIKERIGCDVPLEILFKKEH